MSQREALAAHYPCPECAGATGSSGMCNEGLLLYATYVRSITEDDKAPAVKRAIRLGLMQPIAGDVREAARKVIAGHFHSGVG